jgi:hypothetical protein
MTLVFGILGLGQSVLLAVEIWARRRAGRGE